jgi:hypothetical protein
MDITEKIKKRTFAYNKYVFGKMTKDNECIHAFNNAKIK